MVNIPGACGRIPGVFGPVKYPVKKIGNEYYIRGYSNDEFTGTCRDIAKKIILKFLTAPEKGYRENYVGPFHLQLKPEIKCNLCLDPDPDPADLDTRALSEEITEELKSLQKLIPFS